LAPENQNPWTIAWRCFVIGCSAVLIQYRHMLEGHTDRHADKRTQDDSRYRATVASRGKNRALSFEARERFASAVWCYMPVSVRHTLWSCWNVRTDWSVIGTEATCSL